MWPFKASKQPPIALDDTSAASVFLFDARPAQTAILQPRFIGFSPPKRGLKRLSKVEQLSGALDGADPLTIEVHHGCLKVMGTPGSEMIIEARARVDAERNWWANRLLNRVRVRYRGARLTLHNPRWRKGPHVQTDFTINCPRERALVVRGKYSAVRVSELVGDLDIETSHARITVLDVGPKVMARVQEGIIDYSGYKGEVQLFAGWEVNVNFTGRIFAGDLDAASVGPIRVLLPLGFASSFEASVAAEAKFVCRADIRDRVLAREEAGRRVYTFGEGSPAIRLHSMKGSVVIDNGCNEDARAAAIS